MQPQLEWVSDQLVCLDGVEFYLATKSKEMHCLCRDRWFKPVL